MKSCHRKLLNISFFVLFLANLFSQSLTSDLPVEETENESEFDYKKGIKGPQRWGDLKKEWAACKSGSMQSPIDLSSRRVKIVSKLGNMTTNYMASNATIKNRGHDIMLKWDVGKVGSIKINGTEYLLHQCHWHSPSEHTVNGRRYHMELHMVHITTDENVKNKIAVVGAFFKIGRPDPFLSKLMKDITAMSDTHGEKHMGVIDPKDIKLKGKKYYTYIGSLTVPPCTEGVIWTINKKIRTVSREQVKQIRFAVHDYAEKNSRPVQAVNSRVVHLVNSKTGF